MSTVHFPLINCPLIFTLDPTKINDLNDLQSLLELMGRYGLSELEIQGEGRMIRLKKPDPQPQVQAVPIAVSGGVIPASSPVPTALSAGPSAEPPALPSDLHQVTSPMVGTFYRSSSPEADPFVQEGDRVEEETTLCIIEAMKVMNEIPAGFSGVLREILVKNGEAVEFGQPIFRISIE